MSGPVDRQAIHAELELARGTFQTLMATASPPQLSRRTRRHEVDQPADALPHALRVPDRAQAAAAGALLRTASGPVQPAVRPASNAGTRPFHVVNYLGACGGALVVPRPQAGGSGSTGPSPATCTEHLDEETDETLARRMHFPVGWDPYFRDTMMSARPVPLRKPALRLPRPPADAATDLGFRLRLRVTCPGVRHERASVVAASSRPRSCSAARAKADALARTAPRER